MAYCGAKTRSGQPCRNRAMSNGRCRMHGGKAAETHAGNQHARKHGIYSSILTDEERELWDAVELGKVDDELRLCRLRLMRTIRAETESGNLPELEEQIERSSGSEQKDAEDGGMAAIPPSEQRLKRRDYAGTVDRLMARIESLEKTRADLMKKLIGEGEAPPPVKIEISVKDARIRDDDQSVAE